MGRQSLLSLVLLSSLAVMAPPAGEPRASAPPPPEVPPYPGPLERERTPDPEAVTRAEAKRRRRAALRLAQGASR